LIFSEAFFSAVGFLVYAIVITPYAGIPVSILVISSVYIYARCYKALSVL
jgi:hypothetical protein